ncbi:MAG: Glu/Leu/Phe/Val dehydrogenase dimerization domain-containing protein [Endozoicomonas sp. (ex Botrylloides leachii)]|nr:Glu/Leu/Phe/Val dehydrogenase dimerization domain-containing protein [Endozoicomonas sp. (ex Botrylloides leachii)]
MFKQITEAKLNDLHFKYDEDSGLRSIIAIHSTVRGPALGGCRIIPYSCSKDAVTDVIRLARGMSYKAALAGIELGGGKAVIIQPTHDFSREKLFKAFGRFVNELNGRYITAIDSGACVKDMDYIANESKHVTCTSSTGNPGPYTAKGVFLGIKACLSASPELNDSLSGMRVAVQGLGNVGYALCALLHDQGVHLYVSDVDQHKVSQCVDDFGAVSVAAEDIHKTPCEIFSPCGLGGILSEKTIPELQCSVVAGSANNQLLTSACGQQLEEKGILYAPDYLINSGGLIFVAKAHQGWSEQKVNRHIENIYYTLLKLFDRNKQTGEPCSVIADHMAEAMLFGSSPDT